MSTPEAAARQQIDPQLAAPGWIVPDHTFRRDLHPDHRLSRHGETTRDADNVLADLPLDESRPPFALGEKRAAK